MAEETVSVIIRTKNEERWITHCLRAVKEQTYSDYEIILVDNESTDDTVRKAGQFPVKIVTVSGYTPGKAMNIGVKASAGKYLVFLSGHCIPTGPGWLQSLIRGFEDESIAGIYGRQQPMAFSSAQDKRDLTISFGLDRRIQEKDPFFHNANSAVRRDLWEKYPFDEKVTNIEDRLWAETLLANGYKILYEPEASVFHHHGIHHNNRQDRLDTTVRVLEHMHANDENYEFGRLDPQELQIAAFVPVRGPSPVVEGQPLLHHTLAAAKASHCIKETLVLTDHREMGRYAEEQGAVVPFMRPPEYSQDEVNLNAVYEYCLKRLEADGWFADLIVCMEPTYPFRPEGLMDDLIVELLRGGYNSVLPGYTEYNYCWIQDETSYRRVDSGDIPRRIKSPVLVGLKGLGCVTYPEFLRRGRLVGDKVGLVRIYESFPLVEVRSPRDYELGKLIHSRSGK